ncbi:hypothetical protein AX777_22835 [Sphingobium yanoikuyae]|uniref:Lipoprotein n=1 Tax=Sphingobium yanoikuyae TaxID=13690 RepID=A0A177JIR4_SPHYA|nr:hypothetical protein [Sphingobium yanoikuyae]OAH40694.1 hypothetical protein AX777_22835 [Sphingobium yanoikuyae]
MNAAVKLLSVIGAMALLSSCSPPPIDIAVEKMDGRMILRLSQNWGIIFSDRRVPCVREVGLYEPENHDRSKAAWLIEVKSDIQCLNLASVTVGKLPTGWQEVVRLSASGGRVYTIRAHGIGWGKTNAKF